MTCCYSRAVYNLLSVAISHIDYGSDIMSGIKLSDFLSTQTLQMGIRHFSGLFVLLCVGVTGALLTLAGEHAFYRLVLPHIRRRQKFKYWLHTSQVSRHH